jgi:trans-aconitate methyltransferase
MKMDRQQLITAVAKTVSPHDGMFQGNMEHYLSCGESAAGVLLAAVDLAAHKVPERILDFGSGAGRVTRWLMALFPAATIHACDVRQQDVDFLNDTLGIKAWSVPTDLAALELPKLYYDLIWVGSVITHLPEPQTQKLIEKLFAACAPSRLSRS